MRKQQITVTDFPVLKRLLIAGLVGVSLSGCSALSLVGLPLQMALSHAGPHRLAETVHTQTPVVQDQQSGPISVETLLARARGESIEPSDTPNWDNARQITAAPDQNPNVSTEAKSIRLSYVSSDTLARQAAIIWLKAQDTSPQETVWIVASPNGAPDNPTAVYKGIARAIAIKGWLDENGTPCDISFDAAGEPGTVLLSLTRPTSVMSDA